MFGFRLPEWLMEGESILEDAVIWKQRRHSATVSGCYEQCVVDIENGFLQRYECANSNRCEMPVGDEGFMLLSVSGLMAHRRAGLP